MLLMSPSGRPPLLNKPHVMLVGSTYAVEVINGLSWLMSEVQAQGRRHHRSHVRGRRIRPACAARL